MMGMRMPETCWAVFKRQALKLRDWCIWLVDLFELLYLCLDKPVSSVVPLFFVLIINLDSFLSCNFKVTFHCHYLNIKYQYFLKTFWRLWTTVEFIFVNTDVL
jgi:hypothetical protein